MDETQADIYLVSQFDRSRIIGRPNIYLAVDTATQLIAGVYVGLDAGEEAVAACIANAAMDKREYCRSFGIEIEPEQWPSAGIPREVITDKGGEFLGGRMDELCVRYGIERHALPPFRPDEKGIVEKMFDLKNQRQQCRDHAVGDLELSAALPRSLRSVRVIARPPPPVQLVHQLCVGVVPDAFLLLLGLNGYKD